VGEEVTRLLQAFASGDRGARDRLIEVVYSELRRMAEAQMAKAPPMTLQPTALVHEAYLRLVDRRVRTWENRRHFYFAVGRAMRDVLTEAARRRGAIKRGGGLPRIDLELLSVAAESPPDELIALDDALERLEQEDPRKAEIVHLRFFAGLSAAEAAEVLGMSLRTLEREWRYVRARLHNDLGGQRP
jgi:RNA polymerase sigma factor (TIGR02999 family)